MGTQSARSLHDNRALWRVLFAACGSFSDPQEFANFRESATVTQKTSWETQVIAVPGQYGVVSENSIFSASENAHFQQEIGPNCLQLN
jgi:hypothetical protein